MGASRRSRRNRARARKVRLPEAGTPPHSLPPAQAAPESHEQVTPPAVPDPSRAPRQKEDRWAADDLSATWWDDVWPFNEIPVEDSTPDMGSEQRVDASADPPVVSDPREEDPASSWTDGAPDADEADPAPSPRSRRVPLVAALVGAVVAAGFVIWWRAEPAEEQARLATRHDQYTAPVHLDPDTSYVRSRVLPSGRIEVVHWIRTRNPVRALTIRAPRVPGLERNAILATHLAVVSDGVRLVPHVCCVVSNMPSNFTLPGSHQIFVRYRLAGVTEESGGPDHRALARITALDVSTSRRLVQSTRTVVGAQVLSLACASGSSPPVPCGVQRRGTWSATLGPGDQHSQVMAQVNLS